MWVGRSTDETRPLPPSPDLEKGSVRKTKEPHLEARGRSHNVSRGRIAHSAQPDEKPVDHGVHGDSEDEHHFRLRRLKVLVVGWRWWWWWWGSGGVGKRTTAPHGPRSVNPPTSPIAIRIPPCIRGPQRRNELRSTWEWRCSTVDSALEICGEVRQTKVRKWGEDCITAVWDSRQGRSWLTLTWRISSSVVALGRYSELGVPSLLTCSRIWPSWAT